MKNLNCSDLKVEIAKAMYSAIGLGRIVNDAAPDSPLVVDALKIPISKLGSRQINAISALVGGKIPSEASVLADLVVICAVEA